MDIFSHRNGAICTFCGKLHTLVRLQVTFVINYQKQDGKKQTKTDREKEGQTKGRTDGVQGLGLCLLYRVIVRIMEIEFVHFLLTWLSVCSCKAAVLIGSRI